MNVNRASEKVEEREIELVVPIQLSLGDIVRVKDSRYFMDRFNV